MSKNEKKSLINETLCEVIEDLRLSRGGMGTVLERAAHRASANTKLTGLAEVAKNWTALAAESLLDEVGRYA